MKQTQCFIEFMKFYRELFQKYLNYFVLNYKPFKIIFSVINFANLKFHYEALFTIRVTYILPSWTSIRFTLYFLKFQIGQFTPKQFNFVQFAPIDNNF